MKNLNTNFVNNFTNHNFILDDKFIDMCIDINFYPIYYYTFPPQQFMLDKECKKSEYFRLYPLSITPFSLKNGTLFSKKNIIAPFQA